MGDNLDNLKIAVWDDPVLSKKCDPVPPEDFGDALKVLGLQMIDTMKAAKGDGIGLAAPQVGLSKRLFVMKRLSCEDSKQEIIAVNPKLTVSGEYKVMEEGCLSLPGIYVPVCRQQDCFLWYQEPLTGKECTVELRGLEAVCAQHEYDHIEGVLIIDKTPKHFKKAALKQLRAGNVRRPFDKAQ